MFKRVLLLVCLVAVLVVPGAAAVSYAEVDYSAASVATHVQDVVIHPSDGTNYEAVDDGGNVWHIYTGAGVCRDDFRDVRFRVGGSLVPHWRASYSLTEAEFMVALPSSSAGTLRVEYGDGAIYESDASVYDYLPKTYYDDFSEGGAGWSSITEGSGSVSFASGSAVLGLSANSLGDACIVSSETFRTPFRVSGGIHTGGVTLYDGGNPRFGVQENVALPGSTAGNRAYIKLPSFGGPNWFLESGSFGSSSTYIASSYSGSYSMVMELKDTVVRGSVDGSAWISTSSASVPGDYHIVFSMRDAKSGGPAFSGTLHSVFVEEFVSDPPAALAFRVGSVPAGQQVYRKGTVTMTDNNGTTIRGFEVTAVNAYTDQAYTVATQSDVAVMNLTMDRTITLRNPQTGEYENSIVGYYRFYGQAPGYKMLIEDGIQVAVMPEKYGSYQLCDIGVTPESGYLTGTHQFQIRSRSDNSILQSGTISAKSATTDEWYNTTVSGGIASLILPYDTSNVVSQYAGNYYLYATSPGYEDSDYGTQIVVMPHTVSEIRNILLTPIGGIPTPGNVTLRIQAFSETGSAVVNAEIFVSGVQGAGASLWDTYTASSTGYLTVSVPGNSTYDIVARGAGYYDSARRVEVFTEDPPLIEIKLYLSGAPTLDPTTQPTGWPTDHPTTQPTGGIPDEDDDSEGFLMQAVRGIGLAFGVGFATAKLIFGMLLALSIGYATAKQLRGGAAEFGLGLLGGTLLGVLIGLLPVWIIVVLLLVVGLYIGNRYVGGANNG